MLYSINLVYFNEYQATLGWVLLVTKNLVILNLPVFSGTEI